MADNITEMLLTNSNWTKIDLYPTESKSIKNVSGYPISYYITDDTSLVPTDEYFTSIKYNPNELGGLNYEVSTTSPNEYIWVKATKGTGTVTVRIAGTLDPSDDVSAVATGLNNLRSEFTAHQNEINPHGTTKNEIGLGNLPNVKSDAIDNDNSNSLATSKAVKTVNDSLQEHIENISNPHNTNKGHVGLGNVANFPIADDSTCLDSTNNQVYMTPYSTYKAVSLWLEMSSSCKAQTVVKGTFGNLPSGWSHLDCDYPPEYLVKDSATKISLRGPFQVAFADQGKSRLSNILEDGEALERTFMSSLTGTLYLYVDLDEYGNITSLNMTAVCPYEGVHRGLNTGDFYNTAENIMYDRNNVPIRRVYIGKMIISTNKVMTLIPLPVGNEYVMPITDYLALAERRVFDSNYIGRCDYVAEVEYDTNTWGPSYWNDQTGVMASAYPRAVNNDYSYNDQNQFVLQVGKFGFIAQGQESGAPFAAVFQNGTIDTPCRIRVRCIKR